MTGPERQPNGEPETVIPLKRWPRSAWGIAWTVTWLLLGALCGGPVGAYGGVLVGVYDAHMEGRAPPAANPAFVRFYAVVGTLLGAACGIGLSRSLGQRSAKVKRA
jgi:hypothetical protein